MGNGDSLCAVVLISEAVSLRLLPQGKFLGHLLYGSLEQFLFGILSSMWFGNNITERSNTVYHHFDR